MIPISGLKQRDITGRHNFGWNYAPVDVHTTWWRLTHWGRVTHICVGKLTIIGSDNGLSPERRQAIIWTNAGILLIGPLGTDFSDILIEIQTFSLKKTRLKMSSAKCCSFRLGLNVLSRSGLFVSIFSSHDDVNTPPNGQNSKRHWVQSNTQVPVGKHSNLLIMRSPKT